MNAIMDRRLMQAKGDAVLRNHDAGSGPFRMVEWKKDDHLTLERDPRYYVAGLPRVERLVYRPIADENARTTALRTGEVDIELDVPPRDIAKLQHEPRLRVESVPGTFWEYIGFNTRRPPFNDVRVRQAVAWAVDRDTLDKLVKLGRATVLDGGNIPPSHWAYAGLHIYPKRDVARAKQLLAEAGHAGGFRTTLKVGSSFPYQVNAAQVIKQELRDAGIRVHILMQESGLFFDSLGRHDFDMDVVGWVGFVDPDEWTYNLFHSGREVQPAGLLEPGAGQAARARTPRGRPRSPQADLHESRAYRGHRRADGVPLRQQPDLGGFAAGEGLLRAPDRQHDLPARRLAWGLEVAVLGYLLKRLATLVPMLLGVSVVAFALVRLVPGDTVTAMLGARYNEKEAATLRQEYGLDRSEPAQYLIWLGKVARGNLGKSRFTGTPVTEAIGERLPVTLELAGIALLIALGVGVPLGTVSAMFRQRPPDYAANLGGLVGISVPGFWLGTMLVLVFALGLGWLPSGGFTPLSQGLGANLRHMILPGIALGGAVTGVVLRMTRSSMLEVLDRDYVRVARAKGLPWRTVVVKHALRNAFIPVLTIIGIQAGYLLGGSVVIEQVFSLPGIGRLAFQALGNRDYPLFQATVLFIATSFITLNLAVDLLYAWLDPRLRR